jgi:hypothetical protein
MRLFERKSNAIKLEVIELRREGHCAVVGESYHQDALRATSAICTPDREGRPTFTAVLIPEPDNPYDSNAIAVYSPQGKLGHLSRENALAYRPVLEEVARLGYSGAACEAYVTGGQPDKPSFGLVLQLADPDECLDELATNLDETEG